MMRHRSNSKASGSNPNYYRVSTDDEDDDEVPILNPFRHKKYEYAEPSSGNVSTYI